MRIRIVKLAAPRKQWRVGDVIDMADEAKAKYLIQQGIAAPADAVAAAVETATAGAEETTATRAPRRSTAKLSTTVKKAATPRRRRTPAKKA